MIAISRYTLIKWDIKVSKKGLLLLWILIGTGVIYNGFFMLYYMGAEDQSRFRLNTVKNTPEYAHAVSPEFIKPKKAHSIVPAQIKQSLGSFIDSSNEAHKEHEAINKIKPKAKLEEHVVVPDPPVKILTPEKYNGPAKDSLYKPAIKITPHGRTPSNSDRP